MLSVSYPVYIHYSDFRVKVNDRIVRINLSDTTIQVKVSYLVGRCKINRPCHRMSWSPHLLILKIWRSQQNDIVLPALRHHLTRPQARLDLPDMRLPQIKHAQA
jgi:hypothetical protein